MRYRSADRSWALLKHALGEAPGFVAKQAISATLDTPAGMAQALNCMSLWHLRHVSLRDQCVSGAPGATSVPTALAPLPDRGIFRARIKQADTCGDDDAQCAPPGDGADCATVEADGNGGACGGMLKVDAQHGTGMPAPVRRWEPSRRGMPRRVHLPDEMFGDLLRQLQGRWKGWEGSAGSGVVGVAEAQRAQAKLSSGTAWMAGWRGQGWQNRTAMIVTSELWQKQVAGVLVKAGVGLSEAQVRRWDMGGLPEWGGERCDGERGSGVDERAHSDGPRVGAQTTRGG